MLFPLSLSLHLLLVSGLVSPILAAAVIWKSEKNEKNPWLFDEYVLSFEVGFLKPHPKIYEEALNKAKIPAGECVFIDDLEDNIDGARKVGLDTILYQPNTNLEAELKDKGI